MTWVRGQNRRPDLDPTKLPTAIDIAWSAGIYEGEGTVRMCGKKSKPQGLMAAVVQKDPELLYRLREWFGGAIQSSHNASNCYTWNICGDRARIFIALIHSLLTVRRKLQVSQTNALEFLGNQSPNGMSIEELQGRLIAFNEEKREALAEAHYRQRSLKLLPNVDTKGGQRTA